MRRKTKKQILKEECDYLAGQIIKTRDRWTCLRCRKNFEYNPGGLHSAHIIPKGRCFILRFEPDNLLSLCFACHIRHFHQGGHAVEFTRLAERVIGEARIHQLERLSTDRQNDTVQYLEAVRNDLKAKLLLVTNKPS